jgi:hypothetical protein
MGLEGSLLGSHGMAEALPRTNGGVDCVGFEARGHGADATREAPATVVNSLMTVTRAGWFAAPAAPSGTLEGRSFPAIRSFSSQR